MSLTLERARLELARIAGALDQLHDRWKPHPAQVTIGQALIKDRIRHVMVSAGRNLGKTELSAYLLWRWALTFPKSENYLFAPYMKQAREILWASRRIQEFGPKGLVVSNNTTEMRIEFSNGSFIKLDGSENHEAYRGIKPRGLVVYDEFKDFRPEFHDAFDPNRAAYDAPLFVIGTPPEVENHFTTMAEDCSQSPHKRFFRFPTSANPHVDPRWLDDKKAELYARGEGDKWEREYEARFVRGGASTIFPMLDPNRHVRGHGAIMAEIARDRRKLDWYLWADPAGASCFAVLFVAINPYTRRIYVLDEIYETAQSEMTVLKIGKRVFEKRDELFRHPDKPWRQGYDEAETWFHNEMLDHFNEGFEPTRKAKSDKLSGLSLIKDLLLHDRVIISSRCEKLVWEMLNYRKDDKGKIVKQNDHAIDCLRYILDADNYSLTQTAEVNREASEDFRGARIEDDFPGFLETGEPVDEWEID